MRGRSPAWRSSGYRVSAEVRACDLIRARDQYIRTSIPSAGNRRACSLLGARRCLLPARADWRYVRSIASGVAQDGRAPIMSLSASLSGCAWDSGSCQCRNSCSRLDYPQAVNDQNGIAAYVNAVRNVGIEAQTGPDPRLDPTQAYRKCLDLLATLPHGRSRTCSRTSVTSSEKRFLRPAIRTCSGFSGSGVAPGMPCSSSARAQPAQSPLSIGSLHNAHDNVPQTLSP
jgi:hypothetical protein